jgi:hypothetical protein
MLGRGAKYSCFEVYCFKCVIVLADVLTNFALANNST